MELLLEPFGYHYMLNAMWVSAMVGGLCAFLSCYLMLKGWSLIGDALSHSIVPGVAGAYMLGLPFALGAFLSGGVDSSAVVALMSEQSSEPVKTFSIGFEEQDFSELHHARRVAEHVGAEHHEFIVRPDAMEVLPTLVEHYGERVDVGRGGDGAPDDLFGCGVLRRERTGGGQRHGSGLVR